MQTGNPHDDAHWKRWMLSIWLLMCCALVAFRWANIDFLILADTDDNLRLAQVESWLGGQLVYKLGVGVRRFQIDRYRWWGHLAEGFSQSINWTALDAVAGDQELSLEGVIASAHSHIFHGFSLSDGQKLRGP
jgi:hypothetical protein